MRRQKQSRFLIFTDETLSRRAVNPVEVLVSEWWKQCTHEHRRNNRQEKCEVIPHRKFAPNGDVHRQEHRKHHAADHQRRAQRLGRDIQPVTAPAATEVTIAIKSRAHFMPNVNWSVEVCWDRNTPVSQPNRCQKRTSMAAILSIRRKTTKV